jgi:NADH:ubiquinone reductase (H+-translocating)
LADVTEIYPSKNEIHTSIGNLHYDFLVIATGATTNFYGNKQLIKNCLPLKSIDDAIHLRNKILNNFEQALLTDNEDDLNSLMDYIVVGGGPTGVEVSGALGELKLHVLPIDYPELDFKMMDVHLIQSANRLLPSMSEASSKKAYDYLRKFEVDIWLNTRVLNYDGYYAELSNGQKVITKTMIWAAGIMGQPIAGLDEQSKGPGSRIKVDEYNRVLGHDNIFAIGDVACMIDEKNPAGHPQMAQPAMQMGKHTAQNIINLLQKKPMKPFYFKDPGSMATVGRNKAVVEVGKFKSQGFFAWFIWMFVHLIAVVGYRNRFVVFVNWMVSYLSYDKGIRLIIGDDTNVIKEKTDKEPAVLEK